jgi:hypothetical protein
MAATGKVIGTVTAVVGEAKATAADGTVRILQVGDQVRSDEAISTSAAGSINVALDSGKTLDCGGDVNLTLHESILGVATAASAPIAAPASDVDAIQRAIAAGQDPSQVAAATAAGGAPAAGGADADGGAHEPVILEQSNTASIVTSGFTTEGDTITIAAPQTESLPGVAVASVSAPVSLGADSETPSIPAITIVESVSQPQVNIAADQPVAPVSVVEPAQSTPAVIVEVALAPVVQNNEAPQAVVTSPVPVVADEPVVAADAPLPAEAPAVIVADASADNVPAGEVQPPVVLTQPSSEPVNQDAPSPADTPVIVATDPAGDEEVAETPQPPLVVTQPSSEPVNEDAPAPVDTPVIVATEPAGDEEVTETPQPPIVVTQPEDETVVVNEPEDDTVVVAVPSDVPADLPDSASAGGALTYSISANTNQDEQLALLTFENGNHTFQSLVFFHQQGQQKPMAVPLEFDLDYGVNSTIKLQYIDAFAGNSDSSTGHTAQKIAIKDFALGQGEANTLIAQESDGVNVGLVGRTMQTEGTVVVKMNDPSTTADDAAAGPVGDWSYTNPVEDVNDRATYDGTAIPQADAQGVDILDVTVGELNVAALGDNDFEVIALKGSGEQTLTLKLEDVLNVTGENVLHVIGGTEESRGSTVQDTLNVVGSGWEVVDGDSSVAGFQPSYFGWVQVTHSSGATLLVDPDVNVNLMG